MSNEYSAYFHNFDANQDPNRSVEDCACGGGGWLLSQVDTWHHCLAHFNGQPHPEDNQE